MSESNTEICHHSVYRRTCSTCILQEENAKLKQDNERHEKRWQELREYFIPLILQPLAESIYLTGRSLKDCDDIEILKKKARESMLHDASFNYKIKSIADYVGSQLLKQLEKESG